MPTHTYHSFGLSVELWRLVPSSIGSMLLISPHKHYLFQRLFLILGYPNEYYFPTWNCDCPAEEGVKTRPGNLHILIVSILSPIYYPHRGHPSPYMGSPVVSCWQDLGASDSPIDASRFWPVLAKLFWYAFAIRAPWSQLLP